MNIRFSIHYQTYPGQELFFCGSMDKTAYLSDENALRMTYQPGGYWSLDLPVNQEGLLFYRYLVSENGNISRREWGRHQFLVSSPTENLMEVRDAWQTEPGK